MAVLGFEGFYGTACEGIVQLVLDEVDGTSSETATHDTRTGDAALSGDIVEEVEFLAAHLVLTAQSLVRAVHLASHLFVVTLDECITDSEDAVFLAEHKRSTLQIFGCNF